MNMSRTNKLESLYVHEVLQPQISAAEKEASTEKRREYTTEEEGKRVKQATYDIKYRSRREGIPLGESYDEYISKWDLTIKEEEVIKQKLGLDEYAKTAFMVAKQVGRIAAKKATSKAAKKAYYNTAKKVGTAAVTGAVQGAEERAKEASKNTTRNIGKKKDVKEDSFSWREEYPELYQKVCEDGEFVGGNTQGQYRQTGNIYIDKKQTNVQPVNQITLTSDEAKKRIEDKKVKNKVKINPEMKEEVEKLGGILLSVNEIIEESKECDCDCGEVPCIKCGGDHHKVDESFEIDKDAHKAAQKKSKMRNLARGNENPNEKAAAEKKAGGPKLMGEEDKERNINTVEKIRKLRLQNLKTVKNNDKVNGKELVKKKRVGILPTDPAPEIKVQ